MWRPRATTRGALTSALHLWLAIVYSPRSAASTVLLILRSGSRQADSSIGRGHPSDPASVFSRGWRGGRVRAAEPWHCASANFDPVVACRTMALLLRDKTAQRILTRYSGFAARRELARGYLRRLPTSWLTAARSGLLSGRSNQFSNIFCMVCCKEIL